MKLFLNKLSVYGLICSIGILGFFSLADGGTDEFYAKFTTPKQHSLIVGNSRSAWGLKPDIINKSLSLHNEKEIYNFSFNLSTTPYGPDYLALIKKKIKDGVNDGLFIVTVDPWSISSYGDEPNNINNFRERERFTSNMPFVNMEPNLYYLLFHFDGMYIDILERKLKPRGMFVHDNGWYEVDMGRSTIPLEERIIQHAEFYSEVFATEKNVSQVRLHYLSKLVERLQKNGNVYLVRLPVHQLLFEVEEKYMPDFDIKMEFLANKFNIPYINYSNLESQYEFFDSAHLTQSGAKKLSENLANLIKSKYSNQD